MRDAGERIAAMAQMFRDAQYDAAFIQNLTNYLRGQIDLETYRQSIQPHRYPALNGGFYLSHTGGTELDEVDLRLLDVCFVLSLEHTISFLRCIAVRGDVYMARLRLRQLGMSDLDFINLLARSPLNQLWLDSEHHITALGKLLLAYLPAETHAVLAGVASNYLATLELVKLLLIADPPQVDLAAQAAEVDPRCSGQCVVELLHFAPARFAAMARRVARSASYSGYERLAALRALTETQPGQHIDLAVAIVVELIPQREQTTILPEIALKAAFTHDPAAYWSLGEQAALSPNAILASHALELLAKQDFDRAMRILERCAREGATDAALAAVHMLLGAQPEQHEGFAVSLLGHKSKQMRDKLIEWLVGRGQATVALVTPLLDSKNAAERESAALILGRIGGKSATDALRDHLDGEKSAKVKQVILDAVGTPAPAAVKRKGAQSPQAALIADAAATMGRARRPTIPLVGLDELRWAKGGAVPLVVIDYLLYRQSRVAEIAADSSVAQARELLDPGSAGDWAAALFAGWLERGAAVKEVWTVTLAAALGDDRLIAPLYKAVDELSKGTRGAVAAKAVRALGVLGSDLALVQLDDVAARFKHRQVRDAAREAFAATAARLKISEDELGDRIVPSLGLDKRGERVFDYGPRRFSAHLGPDLALTLFNEDGKKIAVLPKPNKGDDADRAVTALADLKLLKAQLKQAARLQAQRIERALISQRGWAAPRWRELFLGHALLRPLAVGLIWGLVAPAGAGYSALFRPLEDGSLTDADDEAVELPASGSVRLLHPVDLDAATRDHWLQHLADYEVKQPFVQLARTVLRVLPSDRDKQRWDECHGYVVPAALLKGRYLTAGWERGSVQDAGVYNTIWKYYPGAEIEAVLEHWGIPVAWDEGWNTALLNLAFVRAGSIQRGSYVYDDLDDKDNRAIKLGAVPPLIFSEATADLAVFAAAGQKYEDWEKRVG